MRTITANDDLIWISHISPFLIHAHVICHQHDCQVLKDTKLANALYERLAPFLPLEIKDEKDHTWRRCGLNECFRYCRYKKGQLFRKHTDGNFVRSDSEASIFTVNIYLNGQPDFEGGATRFFLNQKDSEKVTNALRPKSGDALVFNHSTKCYLHDGERYVDVSRT